MINKTNWRLMKKYLDYRLQVDQIAKGSLVRENTHMRYLLQWAGSVSYIDVVGIRPAFPVFLRSARLDGKDGILSAVYTKKVLSTARTFFTWLSDNEAGYRFIKQSWVKTLKIKRLSDVPKIREIVTLEEILQIASQSVNTLWERRCRASLVFLYLSCMRIGAFVSVPIQAVDISNRVVNQFPSLGVRTKNRKHGTTFLLDIPELLKVVQDWDDEVRSILPPGGFWFAPLSYTTGEIDPTILQIGEHRGLLAARNFREWMNKQDLPYHPSYDFRHGHIHYGLLRSKSIADYKAVSLNALHSTMKITDEFYSILQADEVKNRISSLSENSTDDTREMIGLLENLLLKMRK